MVWENKPMNVPDQCPITPCAMWPEIQFYTKDLLNWDHARPVRLKRVLLGFTDFFGNNTLGMKCRLFRLKHLILHPYVLLISQMHPFTCVDSLQIHTLYLTAAVNCKKFFRKQFPFLFLI